MYLSALATFRQHEIPSKIAAWRFQFVAKELGGDFRGRVECSLHNIRLHALCPHTISTAHCLVKIGNKSGRRLGDSLNSMARMIEGWERYGQI